MNAASSPSAVLERARELAVTGTGRVRYTAAMAILDGALRAGDDTSIWNAADQLAAVTGDVLGADAGRYVAGEDSSNEGDGAA